MQRAHHHPSDSLSTPAGHVKPAALALRAIQALGRSQCGCCHPCHGRAPASLETNQTDTRRRFRPLSARETRAKVYKTLNINPRVSQVHTFRLATVLDQAENHPSTPSANVFSSRASLGFAEHRRQLPEGALTTVTVEANRKVLQSIEQHAEALGQTSPCTCIPYPHPSQGPIGSFGIEIKSPLQTVGQKDDLEGFSPQKSPYVGVSSRSDPAWVVTGCPLVTQCQCLHLSCNNHTTPVLSTAGNLPLHPFLSYESPSAYATFPGLPN